MQSKRAYGMQETIHPNGKPSRLGISLAAGLPFLASFARSGIPQLHDLVTSVTPPPLPACARKQSWSVCTRLALSASF